jgi:hypothetical protein
MSIIEPEKNHQIIYFQDHFVCVLNGTDVYDMSQYIDTLLGKEYGDKLDRSLATQKYVIIDQSTIKSARDLGTVDLYNIPTVANFNGSHLK